MDNNNFEQQFTQDIKANARPIEQNNKQDRSSFVMMVVIAIFVLIQLIVSIIIMAMVAPSTDSEDGGAPDSTYGEPDNAADSLYDDNDYLVALTATCISDNGTTISLTKDNTYERTSSDSTTPTTGTYSITRGSVFDFTGATSDKYTLFYDGYSLTDGTIFYNCEATTESDTE